MSLSFVASAVQTGTANGGFEETPIESKAVEAVNRQNRNAQNQPLFEQLRQKQEDEQLKQEEFQREMMRGTRALDEEDAAHLDSVQRQRQEREHQIQQRTLDELAAFRAARAEQRQMLLPESDDDDNEELDDDNTNSTNDQYSKAGGGGHESSNHKLVNHTLKKLLPAIISPVVKPKILVKKKRKQPLTTSTMVCEKKSKPEESSNGNEVVPTKGTNEKNEGLGGLLCGYGSSSSDEEKD
jgi:hypothetical protein